MNTNEKGAIAEMAIALAAVRHGFGVLKPLSERQRYDLALELQGRLMRVQCKWGQLDGDVIKVRLGTSRCTPVGYVRTKYTSADTDAFAVYCDELSTTYLIPIGDVEGQACVYLRLREAKNGQRAGLNFAAAYELGAVAQLGERSAGSRKVGGSNPPSSIQTLDGHITVGADQFNTRCGWYMQQAAAGTEVHVSKRGKPYVRLLAA